MATSITKAEFETLPDSLKAKFKGEGDGYILIETADEDLDGLKRSKAEILAEKKKLQARLDELEKFKTEHEQARTSAEEEKMKAAGEFAELEKKLRSRIAEVEAEKEQSINDVLGTLKREQLKSFLVEKGVLPDRAAYALADTYDQFDIERGESGFSLRLKNGIGDAKELETVVEGLKSKSPFLFSANGASGSGASGSETRGSGSGKTMPITQWRSLSVKEQAAFMAGGGALTE